MSHHANPFSSFLLVRRHRRPTDRLLSNAVDLARRSGARLTFVHALEGGDRIDPLSRDELLRELEELLAPHLGGLVAEYQLVEGDLAAAAVRADSRYDLIIPADGEPGSETAERELSELLRRSPLPVWLDRSTAAAPGRILAALDLESATPETSELNLPILRRALHLSSLFEADLDLLTVRTPPAVSDRLARRLAGNADDPRPTRRQLRDRLQELLHQALETAPSPPREPRLLVAQGDADAFIAQAVESTSVRLLVAGCLGRTGLAGWLIGDTAERLSRQVGCSILAVKPRSQRLDVAGRESRSRAA